MGNKIRSYTMSLWINTEENRTQTHNQQSQLHFTTTCVPEENFFFF